MINLRGNSADPRHLKGDNIDVDELLPRYQEGQDINGLCHIYLHKLILSYLFHDDAEAFDNAKLLQQHLVGFQGMFLTAIANLYISLAHLAMYSRSDSSTQELILQTVR